MRVTKHINCVDLPNPDPELFEKQEFARLLRVIKDNMSVREFAALIGVSESYISKTINGFTSTPPTKRIMAKILSQVSSIVEREELAKAAGYPTQEIDWEKWGIENSPIPDEILASYYEGDDYMACGRLMKYLAEHGASGSFTALAIPEHGYFEITDNKTLKVYTGINACYGADARVDTLLRVAFVLGIITSLDDASERVVLILTNNNDVLKDCEAIGKNFKTITVVPIDDRG